MNKISIEFAVFANRSGFINVEKISFHSFRSGFLESAIFNNNLKSNNLETTLGNIAIVAGWALCGDFLNSYVKIETRKTIIANNVANFLDINPVSIPQLMDPNLRHNNKITKPLFEEKGYNYNYKSFVKAVNNLINLGTDSKETRSFWNTHVYSYFVGDSAELKERANTEYKKHWNNKNFRKRSVDIEIGRAHVNSMLNKNNQIEFETLVNQFSSYKNKFLTSYTKQKELVFSRKTNESNFEKFRCEVTDRLKYTTRDNRRRFWNFAYSMYAWDHEIKINFKQVAYKYEQRKIYVENLIKDILKDDDEETYNNLLQEFLGFNIRFLKKDEKEQTKNI